MPSFLLLYFFIQYMAGVYGIAINKFVEKELFIILEYIGGGDLVLNKFVFTIFINQ